MEHTLAHIAQADDYRLQQIFQAVYARYQQLRPELEILVLWLDKQEDKTRQLERMISLLESRKASSD